MRLKGSMTMEAAFIFPMIITIIFAIIFFAYYKHDIVVLKSAVRTGLIQAVNEDSEDFLMKEDEKPGLFYLTFGNMVANYRGKEGSVSADVNFKIFTFVAEYLNKGHTDGSFEEKYKAHIPQEFARQMTALDSFFDE